MAETVTKLPIKQEKCRLHHLSHGCGSRSKAFARKLTACSMISGKAFGDHSDGRFLRGSRHSDAK